MKKNLCLFLIFLLWMHSASNALADTIKFVNIPKPSERSIPTLDKDFPKHFPKYEKCFLGEKRYACYRLEGVKKLLWIWERLKLLEALPPILRKQKEVIAEYAKLKLQYRKEREAFKKAIKSYKNANAGYKRKIIQQEKEKIALRNRALIIGTVVVVLATSAGVIVGYFIAKR